MIIYVSVWYGSLYPIYSNHRFIDQTWYDNQKLSNEPYHIESYTSCSVFDVGMCSNFIQSVIYATSFPRGFI